MLNYDLRTFGMIFDLSNRQINGIRIVDTVKNQVVEFISKYLSEDDSFYLYHPATTEILRDVGNQVSAVGNYETDGYRFNLSYALKQTLYVIAAEEIEVQKNLCLITDRWGLDQQAALTSTFDINDKDQFECEFFIVGIGNYYRRSGLAETCDSQAKLAHLDDPGQLLATYKPWFERSLWQST